MVSNIDEQDIINVAKGINKELSAEQINKVLHMYPHEEECDPTGTWNLIVEHCIYKVINEN